MARHHGEHHHYDDHEDHHHHHHDHDHDHNHSTMKTVLWEGKPFHMTVAEVPKPKIEYETDAILRITTAAICGTDLHTFHGKFGSDTPPWPMGHEAIGVVVEIGDAVKTVKVGDKFIIPDIPDDGKINLTVPTITEVAGFGFGPLLGNLGGCQAEFLRCPFADQSLIPIPSPTKPHHPHHHHQQFHPSHSPSPPSDLDFLFISDIWPTAWTCLDFSGFQPGDTVAVFGAGPVGLLCAYSALLRGASRVYSIDHVPARLEKAASIGAIPINFREGGDPVAQILKLEPNGVNRSCDCCGFECVNENLKPQTDIIIRNAVSVTATGGGIGVIGVYFAEEKSAGAPRADPNPNISFNISDWWAKGLTMKGGTVDPKSLMPLLVELVKSGRARPSFIVSSEIGIDEAPEGYRRFSAHRETKVVIKFPGKRGRETDEDELAEAANEEALGNEPHANGTSNGSKRRKRTHQEL